jgi:hypothetical protein
LFFGEAGDDAQLFQRLEDRPEVGDEAAHTDRNLHLGDASAFRRDQ